MICLSKFLRNVPAAKYQQRLKSRKCDLGDLVVAHVTGRKVGGQLESERGERERVAAECYGSGLASGHPSFCDQASPGAAFKVSPWGGLLLLRLLRRPGGHKSVCVSQESCLCHPA